jgi:putative nucleotidyltransferase with HDIG domain
MTVHRSLISRLIGSVPGVRWFQSFFVRQRLVRRGLASVKLRRRLTKTEWVETLMHGGSVKGLLLISSAALLSWATAGAFGTGWEVERLVIGGLVTFLAMALLWMNHPRVWADNSRLLLIFGALIAHVQMVRWVTGSAIDSGAPGPRSLSEADSIEFWELAVPYALAPLAISVLLGQRLGIVVAIFASLFGSMLRGGMDARFLVISVLTGFVASMATRDVRRRSDLLRAGVMVGVTTVVLSAMMGHLGRIDFQNLAELHWEPLGWKCAAAFGSGLVAAFVVSGLLPVIEGLFRITTPVTWLELADLNHPLLKRMTIDAPGTYHHSLMVAQLSEAAAEVIGANAAMVRVCSYFHDIGKLVKPEYFIENARHGRNAHEDLAPTMSALVIIAHVKEGVDLAIKHRLNREIVDVIQQHHGTSLVYYFYKRAIEQRESEIEGTDLREDADISPVDEDSFRYHGPRPQSRECAIISLADSIESASRSLEKVTAQKIDQLVDDILERRLIEGQMKECDLLMTEYEAIGESFKRTLRSMLHTRISYPKPADKRESSVFLKQPRLEKTDRSQKIA